MQWFLPTVIQFKASDHCLHSHFLYKPWDTNWTISHLYSSSVYHQTLMKTQGSWR